ncbi:Protein MSS2, mitochondrial [Nakaseomyces bracarensis]|uniref:Protein MSS2, mitochondrial n=1 Tax=Nakaseomyces bracarensis TaxID=273131 RepID=A0ABR4NMF9_9SACH
MSFLRSLWSKQAGSEALKTLEISKSFNDHFPRKKTLNKLLFDLNSRLAYKKLYPVCVALYHDAEDSTVKQVLQGVRGSDLMIMRNALEKVRNRTRYIRQDILSLESKLLDKAAELGDNDAISLLSFNTLKEELKGNETEDDGDEVEIARKLFKELYNIEHPLTIKLLGDLSLDNGNSVEALKFYRKFIDIAVRDHGKLLYGNDELIGEVYGKIGEIEFTYNSNILKAEENWIRCLQLTSVETSVRWYYLLSQVYMNSEPMKARILLEKCAAQGFKESFTSLGFIEMNLFDNIDRAKEWFKLGMEVFELQSFIGFFDCCVNREDWISALKCFRSIEKISKMESFGNDSNHKPVTQSFLNTRAQSIEKVLLKAGFQ